MCMHDETQNIPTFNDVPCLLANIDEKLGIIVEWIQSGGSQQDPHAILTIDEAVAFTGYSKSAIHSATSKDTIPHFKRGNKLFFFKDELVEWLKSDNRPKRGKRFQDNNSSKEPVVTDGNQESVSNADETANDTNSVAEVTDSNCNQAEKATSVPEEAVSTCQSSDNPPSSKVFSDAKLEQKGSDDESKDTSTEPAPTSGTDVDSSMERQEEMTTGDDSLADEHISNNSVEQQGTELAIPSFPFFSLERQEATDGTPSKAIIRFFKNIAYEHFRPVCNTVEKFNGHRIDRSVNFEFATYEEALQAALAIDSFMSPRPSESN